MLVNFSKPLSLIFVFFFYLTINAQNSIAISDSYINENINQYKLTKSDINDWIVTDNYVSKHNGVNHIYYQQTLKGIPLENALINVNVLKDGSILNWNSRFVSNLKDKATGLTVFQADHGVNISLAELNLNPSKTLTKLSESNEVEQTTIFSAFGNVEKDIVTKLIYTYNNEGQIVLAWMSTVSVLKPEFHEWKVYVNASSGEFIKKIDQVLHCNFGDHTELCNHNHNHNHNHNQAIVMQPSIKKASSEIVMTEMYNVFAYPVESPNHGNRTIESVPSDPTASPFGWHDTDGVAGAEYTITRGNNVHAQEDINGNNGSGSSPDGGASLIFDYTLDFNEPPSSDTPAAQNLNSSLTNLFYWNNIIHDVFYGYGFDEVSGNYQDNNYGNGGIAGDYVLADGLDGSGSNNANFSPGVDGVSGRMQMFLWNNSSGSLVTMNVNAPANVVGNYAVAGANFGSTDYNITGDVVEISDGSGSPSEGCGASTNAPAITGNIALIDRGGCEFGAKALNAQNAGAVAVIVCNNVPGNPIAMGPGADGASVTIPAVMIGQSDCATLRLELGSLNVTMTATSAPPQLDGSFDNGIIAHEYGHGISTRLTGGPSTSCLNNAEQAGEGWSDFFGLVLSHEPGDSSLTSRGIGTYASGQTPFGGGIRDYPYTTDMTINPSTYNTITTASIPHGVGAVFCTMLWDLYWDLVDEYGYDTDLYNGSGGNNIAIQLVIDGLKLQPCSPGFIDSRDAILAADLINNGGVNQCLIWNAFANRGLGLSATQGSSGSRSDGVEAYDVPSGLNISDINNYSETVEGEVIELTGTAQCGCVGLSDVELQHIIPPGMSIVALTNGNQSGDTIKSNIVDLMPLETVSISYTAKVDICNTLSDTILFEDDIEGPDKFTSQVVNITGDWVKTNSPTNSGTNAWYGENLSSQSDFALTLDLEIPLANRSVLSFFHRYSTEANWDGGVVEISTDNGVNWEGLSDKFISNGYQGTINVNPDSGISGQVAFTGSSDVDFGTTDFIESRIELNSFTGSNILVRFRFVSDGFSAGSGINGWIIDDVKIQNFPILLIKKEVMAAAILEDSVDHKVEFKKLTRGIIFVDIDATGSNIGDNWTNAMTSMQNAIDLQACNSGVEDIYVKEGIYAPTTNSDRNISFNLRDNTSIYGGFIGTETTLAQRILDPAFVSMLSGAIGAVGDADNSHHIIKNVNISNMATVDGFTIQDGNCTVGFLAGSGILNENSMLTVRNCNFLNNKGNSGGAFLNYGNSNAVIDSCMFADNSSIDNTGRAIYNFDGILLLKNLIINDIFIGQGGSIIRNAGAGDLKIEESVEIKQF